jgi:signal transduction histidine kinase
MYRIVCELINNTLKHANANTINICLNKKDTILYLVYTDDGVGFIGESNIVNNGGMGLDNMINRLKSVNGIVKFDSVPGEGMKAVVEINLISK